MQTLMIFLTIGYTLLVVIFVEKFIYTKNSTSQKISEKRDMIKSVLIVLSGMFLLSVPLLISINTRIDLSIFVLIIFIINSLQLILYGFIKMLFKRILHIYYIYIVCIMFVILFYLQYKNNTHYDIGFLYFCITTFAFMFRLVILKQKPLLY